MRTITSEFTVRGRWTEFPGKEAVVGRIRAGEKPILKLERDEDGAIVLINPEASEEVGLIPPCPHYEDDYDILEALIDLGLTMDAVATKVTKKKHYRVRVSAYIE